MQKKLKKKTRSQLVKEADNLCSLGTRMRCTDKNGIVTCPLCGWRGHWKDSQNMHFIKRSVLQFRWDYNNCFPGCYRCNCILNGNYIEYTRFMQKMFGIHKVDKMIADSKKIHKVTTPELEEIIVFWKEVVENAKKKLVIDWEK